MKLLWDAPLGELRVPLLSCPLQANITIYHPGELLQVLVWRRKKTLRHSTSLIFCYTAGFFISRVTGPYKVMVQAHSDLTEEEIYIGGWPA